MGGVWGNSWDELSGGPKRKTRNTRIPWLLRYVGHEATFLRSRLYDLGCGTVLMELCEDIMETLVCPHAILISDGHGFNDLTRWQCSGMSDSVMMRNTADPDPGGSQVAKNRAGDGSSETRHAIVVSFPLAVNSVMLTVVGVLELVKPWLSGAC